MRKEFGQALRRIFSQAIKRQFPQFVEVKVDASPVPGERAYRWVVADNLYCWIVLTPNIKHESFNIMLGWSRLGRYPELPSIPCGESPSSARSEFVRPEYLERLPHFWSEKDEWWVIQKCESLGGASDALELLKPIEPECAVQLVEPQVGDAIEKLRLFGVPYLEEFARAAKAAATCADK